MKVLFVDVYPDKPYRINKDVNGGFGTANNFGTNIFTSLLSRFQLNSIAWPPLYMVSALSVLEAQGHHCQYTNSHLPTEEYFDIYIFSTSVVCCETELQAIGNYSTKSKPILAVGPFSIQVKSIYISAGAHVIGGEPDLFFMADQTFLYKISNENISFFESPPNEISLSELPLMRWDKILQVSPIKMSFLGRGTVLPVFASRGCPYSCFNYCTYPLQQGRVSRLIDPSIMVDRLEHYSKYFRTSKFLFRDPVFTLNKKHVIAICNEIINRGLKFHWGAELHLKDIDLPLAKLMHKAGLRIVFAGIESIDKESIALSKRFSASPSQQMIAIDNLESSGISVKAMFIFGLPEDSLQNALKTIQFATSLPVTYLQFSVFTPYPGTPIYNQYKNLIKTTKYEDFTQWDLIFSHPNLSSAHVRSLLGKAYMAAYFSVSRFFRILYRITKIETESFFNKLLR